MILSFEKTLSARGVGRDIFDWKWITVSQLRKFTPRNSRCFWLLRASNKCSPQCIVLSCCCLLLSAIRLTLLSVFVLRIIRSLSGSSYFLYDTCMWEVWLSHVKHWAGNPQWHTWFLHDSVLIPLSNGTYHWLSHEWGLMYCLQNNELRILEQRWPWSSDTGLQGLRQSLTHNLTVCSSVFWVHFSKLLFFCTCSNLAEYCSTYIYVHEYKHRTSEVIQDFDFNKRLEHMCCLVCI